MKIHSCTAAVAATLSLVTFPILADTPADDDQRVVVTGSRASQSLDSSLASIEVISREDIEQLQPQSVADLLTRLTGVDITHQGGIGQNTSLFLRGSAQNHNLILIDGMRVGSATLGYKSLASIPLAQIERIEVLRGPRAAIWGSDAIGGVIQIFTRHYDKDTAVLNISRGSNSYQSQSFVGAFKKHGFDATITASYDANEGFDVLDNTSDNDDDGYRRGSLAIATNYQIADSINLRINAQRDSGQVEYDASFGATESDYANTQLSSKLEINTDTASHGIALGVNKDAQNMGTTFFNTKRKLLNYVGSFEISDNLQLTGGLDFYKDELESTTVYDITSRDTQAGFIHLHLQQGALSLEGALRHDNVEGVDSESSYNLGLGYKISNAIELVANIGTGFKAPTFNDLYFPASPFSSGNPNLKSETSFNYELSGRWNLDNSTITLTYFDNSVDDLIVWEPDQNFFYSPQNVNKATLKGWEASTQFEIAGLTHDFNLTLVDATDDETGERLIRRADTIANYSIGQTSGDWDYNLHLSYHGDRVDQDYDPVTFMPVMVEMKAYTLVNATIGFSVNDKTRIYLNINNLTDRTYQDVVHYRTAEREFYLGVDWQL